MAGKLTSTRPVALYTEDTHPEAPWQPQGWHINDQEVGSGPIPRNLHSFPKIVGIILPLISLYTLVCGVFPPQLLLLSEVAHTLSSVFLSK